MAKSKNKVVKENRFQIETVIPGLRSVPHLKAFFIKNEQERGTVQEGVRNKAMGIEKGIADILVMDFNTQTIDFLELKRYEIKPDGTYKKAGSQSDHQKSFESMVEFVGGQNNLCKYYLIRTPDDFNEYLKEKKRA